MKPREHVLLFTGRFRRIADSRALLVEDHHQDEANNDAGCPAEHRNSETIEFFHGRYYTDYGATAGISFTSTISFADSSM